MDKFVFDMLLHVYTVLVLKANLVEDIQASRKL